MKRPEFVELVQQALAELPEPLRRAVDNVAIVVVDRPHAGLIAQLRQQGGVRGAHRLLGLYQGIPLPQRGSDYGLVVPDRILLFQQAIERAGRTPEGIRQQARITVIHELAHYFGIDDERLAELGWA